MNTIIRFSAFFVLIHEKLIDKHIENVYYLKISAKIG